MTRADRILMLLVAGIMPLVYFHFWFNNGAANFLTIQTGHNDPVTELLTPNRRLSVTGPLGESVVEISDGRTRFVSSPCLNQVCVRSGWLTNTGSSTACLPNHISLALVNQHPRFDTINY